MFKVNVHEAHKLEQRNQRWDQVAWVGLGSNQGDSDALLNLALYELSALTSEPLLLSARHHSPPWGVTEQPPFLNQVAGLRPLAHLCPEGLLESLLAIERRLGRVRGERWGPRTIDLDLLAWGMRALHSARLTLPHPRLTERRFVLQPWCELAPDLLLPNESDTLSQLLARCPDQGELWPAQKDKT